VASRQLASRARRAVKEGETPEGLAPSPKVLAVAKRFVAACESGDLDALAAVLAEDAWGAAPAFGRARVVTGLHRVAAGVRLFLGPRSGLRLSVVPLVDEVAVLGTRDAEPVVVVRLLIEGDRVQALRALPVRSER
jgi:hypothetical protein